MPADTSGRTMGWSNEGHSQSAHHANRRYVLDSGQNFHERWLDFRFVIEFDPKQGSTTPL